LSAAFQARPIVDGSGTIGIDDTVWRVTGADIPAGSRVRVTRVDGTALHMELVRDHELVAARAGK
jgi:membrane protein implicated in regulation of membrane protease activity